MRNEDLKTRLIEISFLEIKGVVAQWQDDRRNYSPPVNKKTRSNSKRKPKTRQDKVAKLLGALSVEEAAALLKELEENG